jgi:hypothetical protein
MADITINQLPLKSGTASSTDEIEIDDGASKKTTLAQLPVSTAAQAALDLKINTSAAGTAGLAVLGADDSSDVFAALVTNAPANMSVAIGDSAVASGASAHAFGDTATASGVNSLALGAASTASALNSTSVGVSCTASDIGAAAIGIGCTASNDYVFAFGNTASSSVSGTIIARSSIAGNTGTIRLTTNRGTAFSAITSDTARAHTANAIAHALGSELVAGEFSFRINAAGDALIVDVNVAGTVKSASIAIA